jgi:hypothetical protein
MIRMRPSKQKRKPARLTSMRAAPKPCGYLREDPSGRKARCAGDPEQVLTPDFGEPGGHGDDVRSLAMRGMDLRSPSRTRDQPMRAFHSRPSTTAR